MSAIQRDYGPRGFQALGSAFNPNAALLVPEFIKRFQTNFPVGYTTRETVFEYLQHPPAAPSPVPIYVFIDKTGTIRAQYIGDSVFLQNEDKNIRATIENLLKEPPGGQKKAAARK